MGKWWGWRRRAEWVVRLCDELWIVLRISFGVPMILLLLIAVFVASCGTYLPPLSDRMLLSLADTRNSLSASRHRSADTQAASQSARPCTVRVPCLYDDHLSATCTRKHLDRSFTHKDRNYTYPARSSGHSHPLCDPSPDLPQKPAIYVSRASSSLGKARLTGNTKPGQLTRFHMLV